VRTTKRPAAVLAEKAGPPFEGTDYPGGFPERVKGRIKVLLGDAFGLTNFGVNLTRLKPGTQSALRHFHTAQDEFLYVLEGEAVLITDSSETPLRAGMCAGFKAGVRDAHHLINRSDMDVVYLEIGDRSERDEVFYPDDDLHLPPDGSYTHKDGTPWTR
jgi:uncharacterized cupin superfamily protein